MIQVDVFWSFAMGASFASVAAERLKTEKSALVNKYFVFCVLYLSCVFSPSGVYLLWHHTGWETMFFFTHTDLHGIFPCLFATTNVLLGVFGFLISYWMIKRGHQDTAHALWTVPYTCMFAILSFGYDRFLYPGTIQEWRKGVKYPLMDFFGSEIFYTLLVMGIFVLPPLYYVGAIWPSGPSMNAERKFQLLGTAFKPYYRFTCIIISAYIILWKFTEVLPIGWGVDRLFAFLIGQTVFGVAVYVPLLCIPVKDGKDEVKFRKD